MTLRNCSLSMRGSITAQKKLTSRWFTGTAVSQIPTHCFYQDLQAWTRSPQRCSPAGNTGQNSILISTRTLSTNISNHPAKVKNNMPTSIRPSRALSSAASEDQAYHNQAAIDEHDAAQLAFKEKRAAPPPESPEDRQL